MRYDTLFSYWETPGFDYGPTGNGQLTTLAMRTTTGPYEDLLLVCQIEDSSWGAIRIFHGGPDFGSMRLNLSSPDVLLQQPGYYDPLWRFSGLRQFVALVDCGHMTGSANPVLFAHSAMQGSAVHFWYVLGDAIDDKVDMCEFVYHGGAVLDTLHANADGKTDVILGMPFFDHPTDTNLVECGALRLIYGSSKIPEKKRSVPTHRTGNEARLEVYPNPVLRDITLSFAEPTVGTLTVKLQSVLGTTVFEDSKAVAGSSFVGVHLPSLSPGTYILTVADAARHYTPMKLAVVP